MDEDVKDEAGPFATGLGGALGVAGSILPWAIVRFQPGPFGVIPSRLFTPVRHVMGTRTIEGKVTLSIALGVALLGITALLIRRRSVHTAVGLASVGGGVALVALGISELFRVTDSSAAFNPLRYPLTFRGVPFRHYVDVSTSYGLYVVIAAGAIVLVGSVLIVLRARAERVVLPRHYG